MAEDRASLMPFPPGTAHAVCRDRGEHVCHQPSGRECPAGDCRRPAGTLWALDLCPDPDMERTDRERACWDVFAD